MPEDRTTPMRQPKPRRKPDFDEQETMFTDQETSPTVPVGSGPGRGAGSTQPDVLGGVTPPPFPPPGGAFRPQQPAPAQDRTMLMRERPVPVFAWLVVVDGPDRAAAGTVHTLQPGTTTIGRAPANHVVLNDDAASAQHARIRIEEREDAPPAYVLYDMGSSNGTFVGSRETYRAEASRTYRRALDDGEYLLLGETTLAFKKL